MIPSTALVERFRSDCLALTGELGESLGIAVSGGPDSLALLLLAAAAFPGRVEAATVDHRLRPESAGEARFVAGLCSDLGVPHAILAVRVDDTRSSVQRAAREARYQALATWCAARTISWLATAHQLDDQAETLMMRLLRGSGAGGLAGIRATAEIAGGSLRVVRPLLGWRRAELEAIVAAAGITPVRDPGNSDERFDRARMRRRLAGTGWIAPLPLARSAAALAEAEAALAWAAERAWREQVTPGSDGGFVVDPSGLPPELVRRLVLRIMREGGADPRGEEVQHLIGALSDGKTATLGGYRCAGGRSWKFVREGPRRQSKEALNA